MYASDKQTKPKKYMYQKESEFTKHARTLTLWFAFVFG